MQLRKVQSRGGCECRCECRANAEVPVLQAEPGQRGWNALRAVRCFPSVAAYSHSSCKPQAWDPDAAPPHSFSFRRSTSSPQTTVTETRGGMNTNQQNPAQLAEEEGYDRGYTESTRLGYKPLTVRSVTWFKSSKMLGVAGDAWCRRTLPRGVAQGSFACRSLFFGYKLFSE